MLPASEIKEKAKEIGFDACGIAQVATADSEALFFDKWLKEGNHAGMAYMENHREIRLNPARLVEGAKTVISVALNYYPEQKLPPEAPHIAYYAYGKDYHLVVKEMLSELWTALFPRSAREQGGKGMDRNGQFFCDPARGAGTGQADVTATRFFTDSAPILERYGLESRTGLDREEHEPDYSRKRFFLFAWEKSSTTLEADHYDTPQKNRSAVAAVAGSLPDRSTGRSMPSERPKMPLLSHHRKPRRNPCRTSHSPRQAAFTVATPARRSALGTVSPARLG